MDYQEFEQNVTDYVEGTLDGQLQQRMDAARRADPACEQLARLHEQILAAFEDTPEVEAPAGLAERIVAAAEVREQLAAAEQRAYRRGIWMGVVAAAVGAVVMAVLMYMLNLRTEAAALESATSAGTDWLARASATLYAWFNTGEAAMTYKVTIPIITRAVPVYVLVLSGLITVILAWFREEILAVVDSF